MGRFCIGLDPASAELLKGLLRDCSQKTPVTEQGKQERTGKEGRHRFKISGAVQPQPDLTSSSVHRLAQR